jgi:hypothetical protein
VRSPVIRQQSDAAEHVQATNSSTLSEALTRFALGPERRSEGMPLSHHDAALRSYLAFRFALQRWVRLHVAKCLA